jgi:hypothetical protein
LSTVVKCIGLFPAERESEQQLVFLAAGIAIAGGNKAEGEIKTAIGSSLGAVNGLRDAMK